MQLDVMNTTLPSSSNARANANEARRAERRPPRLGRRDRSVARSPLPSKERRGKDLDDLYLAEMGKSTLLTPSTELEVGERVARAERAILVALASSQAGKKALGELGERLSRGDADV